MEVPPTAKVVAAPPRDKLVVVVLKAAKVASPTTEVTIVGVVKAGEVLNTIFVVFVPVEPAALVKKFRIVEVVVKAFPALKDGEVRVLFVKVSVEALPTSVSVAAGIV